MKHMVFFLMKVTGIPLELVFFKRKTYYENRHNQKRMIKGGALIVSNHKSFWDYITIFFLFFFYKTRPIVSYLIYHKNPVLKFCLKCVGAIVVGKDMLDTNYINEAVNLLKKGKKIIVFPEGHFAPSDELLPFSKSYIKIAYEADVPIITLYTDGRYSIAKRNHIMVGQKHYIRDMVNGELDSNAIDTINDYFVKNIEELRRKMNVRKKNPLFRLKNFFMDLGRVSAYLFFVPIFRIKFHNEAKNVNPKKIDGPFIIASNHRGFSDPIVLINAFWRRRVHTLIAKEVYDGHRLRSFLLNSIGGIRIDRENFDIEAISKCCSVLENARPLLIFPEGHIVHGENNPLKAGAVIIAGRTKSPILPVYLPTKKHWYSRRRVYTGELIEVNKTSMKAINEISTLLGDKIEELHQKAIKDGKYYE